MARISGAVSLNSSHYTFFVDVSEISIDTPGNRSYVKAWVYLRHTRWGWIDPNAYSGSVTINGSTKSFTYQPNFSYDSSGDALLTTYEVWVGHNADGSKTVSVSASYNSRGTYSPGNCSASGSVALTKIDRAAPTVSVSASNITESSFKLSLYANTTCDLWQYSLNNGSSYTNISTGAGTSASITVSASPNTIYNVKVRARKKTNQIMGVSGTLTVKTLGGAKLNSVQSVALDKSSILTFNVTVYNSAYTHQLIISRGGIPYATFTNLMWPVGTANQTVTLTEEQKNAILNVMSNVSSQSFSYQLKTFNGSSQMGNTSTIIGTFTVSADKSAPVFDSSEGFTYRDSNSITANVTGNNQLFVQSQSLLEVTASTASPRNGATITKYVCSVGGIVKSQNNTVFNMGIISSSGSVAVQLSVEDSRGFRTTVTRQIQVFPYTPIQIEEMVLRRINEVEAQLNFSFSGRFSSIQVEDIEKNTLIDSSIRYKKTSDISYSEWEPIAAQATGTSFSFSQSSFGNFDPNFSWDIQLKVSDKITSDILSAIIPPGIPLLSYRPKKLGINNPAPQEALDINGNIRISGNVAQGTVKKSILSTDASGELVAAGFDDFAPGIQYEEKNLNENEKAAIWKFADGTMITSKRRYFNSIVIDKEAGGGAVSTASYELGGIGATFTTYPYVTLTVIASDTAMQGIWIYTAVPSADMMSAYPIIRFAGPYMYKTQGWVHIQAIGRWK